MVLDSLRYGSLANLKEQAGSSVEVIRFEIGTDDPGLLGEAASGASHLFHLAAEKHNQSIGRPCELLRANLEGMYTLIDYLAARSLKKVVFTSSLYAYGRMQPPPCWEDEALVPATVYGISKAAGEYLLNHFASKYGLSFNTLRLFFIYGPGQEPGSGYKSVIVKNFKRILSGKRPVIFGDGTQALDYVYVDDAVEALIAAMQSEICGQTFNVASGQAVSINDLVELMLKVAGSSLRPEHGPADWTAGSNRAGKREKIGRELGWSPKTSLEDGLKATFNWMRGES